jgi:hypothetical protein
MLEGGGFAACFVTLLYTSQAAKPPSSSISRYAK